VIQGVLASGQVAQFYLCSNPECKTLASWRLETRAGLSYWCFDSHLPEEVFDGQLMLITGTRAAYEVIEKVGAL